MTYSPGSSRFSFAFAIRRARPNGIPNASEARSNVNPCLTLYARKAS